MDQPPKPKPGVGRSANDRLKDRWENHVAWSTVGAVVFHAAIIGFVGFTVMAPFIEDDPSQGQMMLLPPSVGEGAGLEGMATPVALPEEANAEVEASEGGLAGSEVGGSGNSDETMDLWAATAERLGRRGLLRAEVVELEPPGEDEGEPEGDSVSVAALDSADLLAELAHADSLQVELSLERLTEIRPELATMIPSMWILLRNPTDVENFLRRSYGRWTLDRDRPATVTVTVWIDTRGSVEWAEVSRSSGRANLDEAALALFNEVVAFRPARHEGVSISGSATFALLFPW